MKPLEYVCLLTPNSTKPQEDKELFAFLLCKVQASDSAEQAEFLVSQSSATCTLGWRSANLIER